MDAAADVSMDAMPTERRRPSQVRLNVLWAIAGVGGSAFLAVFGYLAISYATQRDMTLASHEVRIQSVERSQSRQEAQNEEMLRRQSKAEQQADEILRRIAVIEGAVQQGRAR